MTTEEAKSKAVRQILRALINPLVMMSVPEKELAFKLAAEYKITAQDLLEMALDRARNSY
jgi:hypothetical protein